ncbi:MAG: type IV secretory system conjugative DNA transfer family protein [Caulobacter sp.]|nr:type IV secretory system conjugative DNA transfer family protein [Caulobacter sp.]
MNRFASAPWPLKAAYVSLLAVVFAAAAFALITGVALAGLGRLSWSLDPVAVPGWLWYFRADPQVRRWLTIGCLAVLVLSLIVGVAILQRFKPPLHGAARWATEADLRARGLRARSGVVLGKRSGRLLTLGGPEHVMLYAPTRTGKGVGVVIPNLLSWSGSVVVLDIKRENWIATAGFRAAHGQKVILFDPFDAEGRTARFNPLGHVDRRDADAVLTLLQKLAAMLFPTPHHTDPFWSEAARTGFIGVGGLVAQCADRPFSLGEIYAELTSGDPRERLPRLMAKWKDAGEPVPPAFAQALTDFCAASENTFASIKQTVTARLNIFLSPRVRAATDESDFDLADLRRRRISLYLCASPDNLPRVSALYGLLFQLLIDLNTQALPSDENSVEVLVLLDEFARLGKVDVVAHAFAYVAGYGLRLVCVLQSPAQLRAIYGPDMTEEIMSNCGVEVVFAPKELQVAQALSERLGYYTYQARSQSRPSGLSSGRRSQTQSDQRRALMLPQELMQMDREHLIVLTAGAPPVRGRKLAFYREQAFAARVTAPPPGPPQITLPTLRLEGSPKPMDLTTVAGVLADEGLEPPPPHGASDEEVEAWVDRFLAATAPVLEIDDAQR